MDPIRGTSRRLDLNELRQRALDAEQALTEQQAPCPREPEAAPEPTGYSDDSSYDGAPQARAAVAPEAGIDVTPTPAVAPAPETAVPESAPQTPASAATAPAAATGPTHGLAGERRIVNATQAYTTARAEVDRLNGHLQQALQNPTLRDPAAARTFVDAFRTTHAAAYGREAQAATDLASALREAGPNATRPATAVRAGLDVLSRSSQASEVAGIAGPLSQGPNAVIPRGAADRYTATAADTAVRQHLAAGRSAEEAVREVGTALSGAGFGNLAGRLGQPAELAARFARLGFASAAGSALAAGADFSAFARTGDPASAVAGGLAVASAGLAVAGAVGAGAGAAITVPIAAGAYLARAQAQENEFQAATRGSLERSFGEGLAGAGTMAANPRNTAALQQAGLTNAQISQLATDPSTRHLVAGNSMDDLRPYLNRATTAERQQLIQTMSPSDIAAAARATSLGASHLQRVASAENRAILERLHAAARRRQ